MDAINTKILLKMIEVGSQKISDNFEYINELNVFPVPDGDTGINMKISISGAFDKAKENSHLNLYEFTKFLSRQFLMNARGNSGVIFSQIFRGFFDPIKEGQNEITLSQLPECFKSAKQRSYTSVSTPVEGTILTLIRMLSEEIEVKISEFKTIEDLFDFVEKRSFEIVEMTPEMLPSLKEAGVVDSGAFGLATFFQGMRESLYESNFKKTESIETKKIKKKITKVKKASFIDNPERQDISEEGFGYCCEFICELNYKLFPEQNKKSVFNINSFEKELLSIGNSLVLVQDESLIKVHLHTFTPNKLLELGQKYGEFIKVKIENMTEQFFEKNSSIPRDELLKSMKLSDKTKVITTSISSKYGKYLKSEFGISSYINLAQTGNPSVIDFVNKIDEVKSKNIIIIIDDSNIILSAEQAIKLKGNNINFLLVKAKNPLELLFCLMSLNLEEDFKSNLRSTNKALTESMTLSFSTSTKTLKTQKGLEVEKGNYIGIMNKEILSSNKSLFVTVCSLLKDKVNTRKKPKTFYIIIGKDVSNDEVTRIEKYINENYGAKCNKIVADQKVYNLYIGWW